MQVRRSTFGPLSIIAMTVAAVFATAPAQAAGPAPHATGGVVMHLPAAPKDAKTSASAAADVSPTISPSVQTVHIGAQSYYCLSGNLCLTVWDPSTSDYKVFILHDCRKYSLSHWSGQGWFDDNQTGGVTSYFYGSSGQTLKSFNSGFWVDQDWSPVWSVRNC